MKSIAHWVVQVSSNVSTKKLSHGSYLQEDYPSLARLRFQSNPIQYNPIQYKSQLLATPLRIDLIVNEMVIVECKATTKYNEIFEIQVLTYLRLTGLKLGLVINFGGKTVKDCFRRVVNGL